MDSENVRNGVARSDDVTFEQTGAGSTDALVPAGPIGENGSHAAENLTSPDFSRGSSAPALENEIAGAMQAWLERASRWRMEKAVLEEELAATGNRAESAHERLHAIEGKLACALDEAVKARAATVLLEKANAEIGALRLFIEMNERAMLDEREQHAETVALFTERLAEEKRLTQSLVDGIAKLELQVIDRSRRTVVALAQEQKALQRRLDLIYSSKFWRVKKILGSVIGRLSSRARKAAGRLDAGRSVAS